MKKSIEFLAVFLFLISLFAALCYFGKSEQISISTEEYDSVCNQNSNKTIVN